MELEKTKCRNCGHLHRWRSYKWPNTEQRRAHNKLNFSTCPNCGPKDVFGVEDDETAGAYQSLAKALFGDKDRNA